MLKAVSILIFSAFISAPASAHSGSHYFTNILTSLLHFFGEPVHGGALVVICAVAFALRMTRKRHAPATIRRQR